MSKQLRNSGPRGYHRTRNLKHCDADHIWSDFFPVSNEKLIKRCLKCPAILTKKQFLEMRVEIKIISSPKPRLEVKEHIDLFWS